MSKARQPDHLDMEIGRRLRLQRRLVGETQAGLGVAMGVTPRQIQNYELGVSRLTASALLKMAYHLGCRVSDLLGDAAGAPVFGDRLAADTRAMIDAFLSLPSVEERRLVVEIVRALAPEPDAALGRSRLKEGWH